MLLLCSSGDEWQGCSRTAVSARSAIPCDGSRQRALLHWLRPSPQLSSRCGWPGAGTGAWGAKTCSFKSISCGLQAFYDMGEARRDWRERRKRTEGLRAQGGQTVGVGWRCQRAGGHKGQCQSISSGDSKLFTTENLVSLFLIFDDLEGFFVCLALPRGDYK